MSDTIRGKIEGIRLKLKAESSKVKGERMNEFSPEQEPYLRPLLKKAC